MTVLLLGGTGYLGSNIAKYLSKKDIKIICVVRNTSNINELRNLKNVNLIPNDKYQIELILGYEKVDWIINSACTYKTNSGTLYEEIFESNIIFPFNVLNAAIKQHVINFLTIGTSLPGDVGPYSFTKQKFSEIGKFLSEESGINFIDLRLEMFYGGVNEPKERFLNMCRRCLYLNKDIMLTDGNQKRDIIRVEDVVGIIAALISSKFPKGYRVLPVGSGEQHSIKEIVEFMKEIMQSKSRLKFGTVPVRKIEPDTLADISWYKELKYTMRYQYFEGLEDICRSFLL